MVYNKWALFLVKGIVGNGYCLDNKRLIWETKKVRVNITIYVPQWMENKCRRHDND